MLGLKRSPKGSLALLPICGNVLAKPCMLSFELKFATDALRFPICVGLPVVVPLRLLGLTLRAALSSREVNWFCCDGPLKLPLMGECVLGGVALVRLLRSGFDPLE